MSRLQIVMGISFTLLLGCSSGPKKGHEYLRVGMDKDEVLEIAQNPNRTFRTNSQDRWIYEYYEGEARWLKEVVFSDGKVVQIEKIPPRSNLERSLEQSQSMEEYESKARGKPKTP